MFLSSLKKYYYHLLNKKETQFLCLFLFYIFSFNVNIR